MKKLIASKAFWIVMIVVMLIGGLAAKRIIDAHTQKALSLEEGEPQKPLLPVRVVQARRGPIQKWMYGEGTMRAVRRKFLNFGQTGEVVRIATDSEGNELREGSKVSGPTQEGQKGQLLAELDQRQVLVDLNIAQTALEEARLQVAIAESTMKQAENDYNYEKINFERVVKLHSAGTTILIQEETLAQAKEDVAMAQAAVAQAESELKLAKAQLKTATQLHQERTTIITNEEVLNQAREQVKIAEASLKEAENNYKLAESDFQNKEKLFQSGIISKQQYDEAKNDYLNAENTLNTSKANLQSERSKVKMAESDLKKAKIDSPVSEMEAARAAYQRAKSDLQTQRANLISAQSKVKAAEAQLNETKISTPVTEYEAAKNTYLNMQAIFKTQQANYQSTLLKVKDAQDQVRQSELTKEQASLFAPFDGVITRLNIRVGDYAQGHSLDTTSEDTMMQTAAIVVLDTSEYETTLRLPNYMGDYIRPGQTVYIRSSRDMFPDEFDEEPVSKNPSPEITPTPGEFQKAHRTVTGKVYAVSPSFSEEGRSFLVKIRTRGGEGYLKDGMFVSCRIVTKTKDHAVLIPSKSVIFRDNETYVFVADPDTGIITKRLFTGGIFSHTGDIEVLKGIEEGEQIAIDQRDRLVDGIQVNIIPISEQQQS
jgi:multidrug efflux pump subunit AcrA (membrane-fusion protein)